MNDKPFRRYLYRNGRSSDRVFSLFLACLLFYSLFYTAYQASQQERAHLLTVKENTFFTENLHTAPISAGQIRSSTSWQALPLFRSTSHNETVPVNHIRKEPGQRQSVNQQLCSEKLLHMIRAAAFSLPQRIIRAEHFCSSNRKILRFLHLKDGCKPIPFLSQ